MTGSSAAASTGRATRVPSPRRAQAGSEAPASSLGERMRWRGLSRHWPWPVAVAVLAVHAVQATGEDLFDSRRAQYALLMGALLMLAYLRLPTATAAFQRATRSWAPCVSLATLLLVGPLLAVPIALMGLALSLGLERRHRPEWRASLGDLGAVTAGGAALVVVSAVADRLGGHSQPSPRGLVEGGLASLSAPSAVLTLAVVVATATAGYLFAHAAGRPALSLSDARGVLLRRPGGDGDLPVALLIVFAPGLACIALVQPWLAVLLLVGASASKGLVAVRRPAADHSITDPLTGVANRRHLMAEVERHVRDATATGRPVALLVVDLDRFQEINDGYGHGFGDRVLRVAAQRLVAVTRSCDLVARLGGDEFGVIVPGIDDERRLTDLAQRLRGVLSERIETGDEVFGPGASVGIAICPAHALTASQLMARADAALHRAKNSAVGVQVHRDSSQAPARRLGVVAAVRSALDSGRVSLAYQPKIALGQGPHPVDRLAGVEALLRFDDGPDEPLEPGRVVSLVEGTGIMSRLTTAVLDRALHQVAEWLQADERIPVAVNVSLRDLEDPAFADLTYDALVRSGVPGSMLTLEITERVLTGDLSSVVESMERLQRIGVRLSLDDFGTGWSSLLLLRRLPVAELKLDRSFVAGIDTHDADAAVVETVAGLAHRLGLTMVAEGVERADTLERLRRSGCDVAQGFLFSRALAPEDVLSWTARPLPVVGVA